VTHLTENTVAAAAQAPVGPLEQPADLLRALFEATPGFISSVDRDGTILFANRVREDLKPEDVIGRSIYSFVEPSHQESLRQKIDQVFGTGVPQSFDTPVSANGQVSWFQNRAAPLRRRGHIVAVVIESFEVTDLKATEAKLKERERELRESHALAKIGTWSWDADADRFSWEGELESLLGATPRAARLRLFFDRIHPRDREAVEEALEKTLHQGESIKLEHRVVLRDGSVRWVELTGRREVGPNGPRLVGAAQDVTDRRRLETSAQDAYRRTLEVENLRSLNDLKTRLLDNLVEETTRRKRVENELREANEKLLDLVRFKAELLNVLSHELGNPLTPIKLQVHYMREILAGDAGTERSLDIIDRNVSRVITLSKDMLDVARLETGRLRVERKPLDFAMTVRDVVESFAESAKKAGVEIKSDVEGPLLVRADFRRLEQVLFNVMGNAIKFTPGPGKIDVRVYERDGSAVAEVTDTGLGFTPEQATKLFRPFSRLHEKARGVGPGTGLGLYISKGIMEQHEGAITAESPGPNLGSTFTLELPLLHPGEDL
jgi:PAS domain S-box-containing protein